MIARLDEAAIYIWSVEMGGQELLSEFEIY